MYVLVKQLNQMPAPIIPFGGGSATILPPSSLAPWILDEDRIPLSLAISLYSHPLPTLETYQLVDNTYKTRYAAWIDQNTRLLIVGCRGTQIGKTGGTQDILDDKVRL